MNPLLILVSGPPLTGKSTLIDSLQEAFNHQLVIVSTDDIRQELYGSYEFYASREPEIWNIAFERISNALLKRQVAVLDATLRIPSLRVSIRQRFNEFPVFYIAFKKVPLQTLLERNEKRVNKQFTPETIKRLFEEYTLPKKDELNHYNHHLWVPPFRRNTAIQKAIDTVKIYIEK